MRFVASFFVLNVAPAYRGGVGCVGVPRVRRWCVCALVFECVSCFAFPFNGSFFSFFLFVRFFSVRNFAVLGVNSTPYRVISTGILKLALGSYPIAGSQVFPFLEEVRMGGGKRGNWRQSMSNCLTAATLHSNDRLMLPELMPELVQSQLHYSAGGIHQSKLLRLKKENSKNPFSAVAGYTSQNRHI